MSSVYTSIDQLIGKTPLLELTNIEKALNLKARVVAKLEFFNPAGSVKDRVALNMLDDAKARGLIREGSTIIEPTSGNTGIGLAAVAASRGYKAIIVMPDSMSIERRKLMAAYGAQVVLTPGAEGMAGAIGKAQELSQQIPGSFIPDQFANPANAEAHFKTTGPEIYQDTDGNIDIFVAGAGTGGTITGTGRYLKSRNPDIQIIAVEPQTSPVITQTLQGTQLQPGKHGLQGIGAGFIPDVLDVSVLDSVITCTDENACETARLIGRLEGFLVGISSGAAAWAAIELGKLPENEGKTIVVLLPDTGERYLSAGVFN
ncbi:MAG: cysteine synthase A [Ruminococcaceae bacterium]|nr:cysteine synthase A [Oscillospiraceae bacterium]